MSHQSSRFASRLLTLLLLVGFGSCISAPERKHQIDEVEGATVNEAQLRFLTIDYVRAFVSAVEHSSDEIARQTDDPAVRRNSLVWKSRSVAVAQGALLKPEAAGVFVDLWALTMQMHSLLAPGGPGESMFGEQQAIAVTACEELLVEIADMAEFAVGDEGRVRAQQMVEQWAASHPIDLQMFGRQYPRELVRRVGSNEAKGTFSSLVTLEETFTMYSQVLPLVIEVLPAQARWHAELLIQDYMPPEQIDALNADVHAVAASLVSIDERVAAIQEDVDDKFALTLDRVSEERELVLQEVDRQRVETLAFVSAEREVILEAVDQQVTAALDRIPEATREAIDQGDPRVIAWIDHLVWRLAQLGLAAAALLSLLLLVRAALRRRVV